MTIIIKEDMKYSIWVTVDANAGTGWHREFKELEIWCKENCNEAHQVVQPTPLERVFVFDDESDALAFKLVWA